MAHEWLRPTQNSLPLGPCLSQVLSQIHIDMQSATVFVRRSVKSCKCVGGRSACIRGNLWHV